MWNLTANPFLWQGVVFLFFGLVTAFAVNAIWGFPRRLVEAI